MSARFRREKVVFTLKEHARRNVRLAAIGAVASLSLGSLSATAATLSWDPGLTPATPSGGSSGGVGNQLNNADNNWSNGTTDQALGSSDDAHFGNVGGNVTNTGTPTSMGTLSFDVGGYNISGGSLQLNAVNNTLITNNGNNTISSTIILGNQSNSGTATLNVASGVLTTGNVTAGNYGLYKKTGAGVLNMTGTLTSTNAGYTNYNILVDQGRMILSGNGQWGSTAGNSNGVAGGVTAGASLGGNTTATWTTESDFNINGTLAPGANPTNSNFGGVGTFAFTGGDYTHSVNVHFGSTSILALDLFSPDSGPGVFDGNHDVYKMTAGSYGGSLTFDLGSLIQISGSPVAGTYHIVQMVSSDAAGFHQANHTPITDNGLAVDLANSPAGFTYQVVDLPNNEGIDLIVTGTGIPEPASIGLLGMGAGLLLRRKRRTS
jgi:hypothetical protein